MSFRRSMLFSVLDKYVFQLATIGTAAIMARILTPAETGIYLVASSLILLGDTMRSFGIGPYIVQHRELDRVVLRSAFTLSLIVSVGLWLAIMLFADEAAIFYGEPELSELLRIAAISFLVGAFSAPLVALLQRDFAFRRLAFINIVAVLSGSTVTVGLGLLGVGPASFVWGLVTSGTVTATLAFAARPEAWIFRPSLAEARTFLSFGSISTIVIMLNIASDMLPRLVFGKTLGFDAVGLYARAMTICQLPDRAIVQAMHPVVLPAMAARTRNGGDLRDAYLRGHAMMSAVQWPTLIMIALLADPIVRILLGSQWDNAPPLVRLISLAMMAMAPAFMSYPVLVSVGRIRDTLAASLISLPPSLLITVWASSYGLGAVAAATFVTAPLQMGVFLWFVRRAIGFKFRELVEVSWGSLALALGTLAGPLLILLTRSPDGYHLDWGSTALAVAAGAAGWGLVLWLIRHPLRDEVAAIWRSLPIGTTRKTAEPVQPTGG